MMLFLKNKSLLSMRAIDLMELNIRERCGKEFFYADLCITGLKVQTICSLRRGITYDFVTEYEYE